MRNQINFNNKLSYEDLGLVILEREIKTPSKSKVKDSVPFINGSYDFSSLYGGNCYPDRTLTYTFKLKSTNRIGLETLRIKIDNWLMGTRTKERLYDNNLKGYYFLAECESVDFEEFYKLGKLKATFTAYPFRIRDCYEGNNLWDDFNFELDVLQDTIFNISGTKDITIHNQSATNIIPTVICSAPMEVVKDGIAYKFNTGTSKDYVFELSMGANKLNIKGNGTIEFKFRKEVL